MPHLKKTKLRKRKFNFEISDIDKIDNIICDFNNNKVFPSINDVYNASKTESTLSFKKCMRTTFYNLIKEMGYKYNNTNQIIIKL